MDDRAYACALGEGREGGDLDGGNFVEFFFPPCGAIGLGATLTLERQGIPGHV